MINMKQWVALFKGINVGGNNLIPMKDLVAEFKQLGFTDVTSYIQSGNIVFQSKDKDAAKIAQTIEQMVDSRFGIQPRVIVLSKKKISEAMNANPFEVSESDSKTLHLFFLFKPSTKIDQVRLAAIQKPNERCELKHDVFYLHAPDGLGKSKLATQVEKVVGATVTARNWRTVCAINALLEQIG